MLATLASLPGPILLLDHPHYLTLAGRTPVSHSVAVRDVRDGGSARAREAMVADLSSAVDRFASVVVHDPQDRGLLGPRFDAAFALVAASREPGSVSFRPVAGLDKRPRAIYVRRHLPVEQVRLP